MIKISIYLIKLAFHTGMLLVQTFIQRQNINPIGIKSNEIDNFSSQALFSSVLNTALAQIHCKNDKNIDTFHVV